MTNPGNITGDRDRVLKSIRNASQQVAAKGSHHIKMPDRAAYAAVLPRVADDWDSKLAAFTARCEELRATLFVVDDASAMTASVQSILSNDQVMHIAYQNHPLVMPAIKTFGADFVCVDGGYDPIALEACEVGITSCFALIAQTGSVMVTSEATGGRALSILPPHHIVLATATDLLADLPSAFEKFINYTRQRSSSMLSFISGPSRTGDIERILVLGAHGPKRLTIILQR